MRQRGESKNSPYERAKFIYVAGLGVAPSLEDYEPSVQLYTTPRQMK